jgi:nitrogenase molybdenum-iron protein alpha/beta subunit
LSEPDSDLPDDFREARSKDEPFWKSQEKRIQGSLGQPCCTLSGISTGLINMEGDFAVVIHGEDECASCFRHLGPSAQSFYCTGLTEKEFVTGETAAPLDRCLRLVAEEVKPSAIFVLGACPVEVIGDRFEVVVEAVQADHPTIPMMALHTSGLKVGSQSAMLDWMWSTLAALPMTEPVDQIWRRQVQELGLELLSVVGGNRTDELDWVHKEVSAFPERPRIRRETAVNLVGLPEAVRSGAQVPEYVDVLRACGLDVVANYPRTSSLEAWRAIRFAKASFVADRSLYPKLTKVLEDSGQIVCDVPLPTGLDQTRRFYAAIAEIYGVQDRMAAATAQIEEEASTALDAFRKKYAGLRVAMGLRMLNNYEADQLAYQGLGDHRAMVELGFDLTVMVQGPPDKRDKFERMFEAHGIDVPFEMFAEPWTLSERLGGGRFDAAYLADHCRGECRKAGVPHIVSRELDPFFAGVPGNLRFLDRVLSRGIGADAR